jgi:hypothetical protein
LFQGVILLDTNGESCDADVSDGEEVVDPVGARSSNFTFVGAEIKTGKSSIRSKQKPKKVSIFGVVCGFRFQEEKGFLSLSDYLQIFISEKDK